MSNKNINNGISIIVPTFRRPEGIKRVLESLENQSGSGLEIEIIIADNDPDGGARDFVETYAKKSKQNIIYLHVPAPGVSNARNAALAKARGRYLAFLDDDEEADPDWLCALLQAARKYRAGVCFGRVEARLARPSVSDTYFIQIFSRQGEGLAEGPIDEIFGCGNSLIDTKMCRLPKPPFDLNMNETGGEDDVLFAHIRDQGVPIVWAKQAICYEHVPPDRASPAYVKKRSFSFGQTPSQICADDKNYAGVVKWMFIGCLQYAWHKPCAVITRLVRHPAYIKHLAKACEGAGKVFWFSALTPKLYGAAVVENKVS